MKKTITAWLGLYDRFCLEALKKESDAHNDIPVTITFDDGKPNTKTVWEWMYLEDHCWFTSDSLLSEDDAAIAFKNFPHKKLREFQVEVSDGE